ncbi:MAG: cytidylate kinase-like family protein [Verrucomicrobiota bacterium]
MNENISLSQCVSYIDCQLGLACPGKPRAQAARLRANPSITISRQTGAGGTSVACLLADYLQKHGPKPACPWTVFDKNLMEKVLADHNLPTRLAQYLPEDKKSMIADIMEELLGLHPPSYTLQRQTTETILQLADLGNVILVGRGAHVITSRLENVLHVRLVAPLETRVQRIQTTQQLSQRAAREFVQHTDQGRTRYLKKHFQADIDDPLLYHLVINTDWLTHEETAKLIGDTVLKKYYP